MDRCCKCKSQRVQAIWEVEISSRMPSGFNHGTKGSIHKLCSSCLKLLEEWLHDGTN